MKYLERFRSVDNINESAIPVAYHHIPKEKYENETVSTVPFSELVKTNRSLFLKKVQYISKLLGTKPEWMMGIMKHESTLDPKQTNKQSNATGLIQFMPDTLKAFKNRKTHEPLTVEDVRLMSNLEQLDLVYAYYKTWKNVLQVENFNKPGDLAAVTFYPGVILKNDNWKFPDNVIKANKGMFNKFVPEGDNTKKGYYSYINKVLNASNPKIAAKLPSPTNKDVKHNTLGETTGAFSSMSMVNKLIEDFLIYIN